MNEQKSLAQEFEASRPHLRAMAYRILGSQSEAEDAVQEGWLRLSRADAGAVENLRAWLTTVVARVCLDMLRSRKSRAEDPIDNEPGAETPEPEMGEEHSPEHEALLADSVGIALLVVLDKLTPAERVAFVLHDMFDLSFDDIAIIIGRSSMATRQLASRARRRVQGAETTRDADITRQRQVVDAFLAASRAGDFDALLTLLDPDVEFRADKIAEQMGGQAEIRGAPAVAAAFKGRAQAAKPALIDGMMGLAVILQGQLRIVVKLSISDGKIIAIEAIADPERLAQFDLELFDR